MTAARTVVDALLSKVMRVIALLDITSIFGSVKMAIVSRTRVVLVVRIPVSPVRITALVIPVRTEIGTPA